ncbi:uncharacterized protein LY89DRAFT_782112 [Mollisia scopiformis]|uniref:Uncharacterized protein n=1 Tax=Mollisia scopiformis TaxID=149040 RepID=A0A194X9K2_MOLSC|nr:uncharacterized protein LY89DRAFT_782112 [Mollisia scopiformis]KUJ16855.1 hypothetical protein LY89DRAFT_782112 [Mollisia scopiformis]
MSDLDQRFIHKSTVRGASFVQEILNHLRDDSQSEVQGSKGFETSTTTKQSSKRRKEADRSYRLPKSSRTQPEITRDGAEYSNEASSVKSQVGDDTATCQSGHGNRTVIQSTDSLATEKPFQERERDIPKITAEEVPKEGTVPQEVVPRSQSFADSHTLPSMGGESAVHQLKSTYSSDNAKMNAVHRQLSVALDKAIEDGQTTIRTPSPSAEQRETALSEIDGKGSDAQASSDIPSTPVGKISKGFRSPISDDQTATPQTTVFTPIVNGRLLSLLTEDN